VKHDASWREDAPRRAVLVRRQRVDVADVSRMGCRLEGDMPMAIGAVGMLSVAIAGHPHLEMFRVSRSGLLADAAGRYEAGVEFLPLPADAPSLRDLLS
jgi:hypothetical protein